MTKWTRWRVDVAPSGFPQLIASTRYLPKNHAFGDLIVHVEAIDDEAGHIEFYTSILLEGVHSPLGEEGWDQDGSAAFRKALAEATKRTTLITKMLRSLAEPTASQFAALKQAYQRWLVRIEKAEQRNKKAMARYEARQSQAHARKSRKR